MAFQGSGSPAAGGGPQNGEVDVEVPESSGREAPVRLLATGAALLLVFMIALTSSPSGASASRMSVSVRERPGLVQSYLRFAASRGEENHVLLRRVAADAVLVSDPAAGSRRRGVQPGQPHVARCRTPGLAGVTLDLGDRGDRATLCGAIRSALTVLGGGGDDRVDARRVGANPRFVVAPTLLGGPGRTSSSAPRARTTWRAARGATSSTAGPGATP